MSDRSLRDANTARPIVTRSGTVGVMATTMIGSGLYDATEIGVLVGLMPDQVVRWTTKSTLGDAPVQPTFDKLYSFADLVAMSVAKQIRQHVSDRHLRRGVAALRVESGFESPLSAREVITRLATSGDSFLLHVSGNEFDDIGRGGQGTFRDVVEVHLERIDFDTTGGPLRWHPTDGVLIDPAVQAGAPCIAGTRLPTSVVAGRLLIDSADDVAFDLDIGLAAIEAAAEFERLLADGAGISV